MSAPEVCEGYMLKKKRKRMQGMARRYFRLSSTGALSYSFNPTSPIRDSILTPLAFVSASRRRRTIHIDAGRATWHCKALTEADFDRWAAALRHFVGEVSESDDRSKEQQQAPVFTDDLGPDFKPIASAVAQMSAPIREIETLLHEFRHQDPLVADAPSGSTLSVERPSHPASSPKFKLFKKSNATARDTPKSPEDYFDARPAPPPDALIKQLSQALAAIKSQHDVLAASLASLSTQRSASPDGVDSPPSPRRQHPLRQSGVFSHRPPSSRASSVASFETMDVFEDCIPGEFVLEEEDEGDESDDARDNEQSDESEDEAGESDASYESVEEASMKERDEDTLTLHGGEVQRRDQLPHPVAGDELSLLGLLRKNVGKDLSQISFPVTLNEPISALQRIAEELEYADLLHRAAMAKDPIDRLTLIATFAIAGNAGNKYRTSRKPFNPLLGETYECIRPERGFRFVAEKVSHHPPVLAFRAEAKAWKIDGHLAPSQKFWGRSMEVFATGEYNISFGPDQVYSIRRPSSFVRNLVAGTKFLEVVGDLVVSNEASGEKAVVSFKEGSAWGGQSSRNKVEGKVYDEEGNERAELVGRWDEHVDRKEGKHSYERLWEVNEFPANPQKYYGFSHFCAQLNEVSALEEDCMAPSDSRLRPDQRALETGAVDDAEETKKRVEEKQRTRRKDGTQAAPQWFEEHDDGSWMYTHRYWEVREKKEFSDPDLF